MLHSCC